VQRLAPLVGGAQPTVLVVVERQQAVLVRHPTLWGLLEQTHLLAAALLVGSLVAEAQWVARAQQPTLRDLRGRKQLAPEQDEASLPRPMANPGSLEAHHQREVQQETLQPQGSPMVG
jgi:hypothetical protein